MKIGGWGVEALIDLDVAATSDDGKHHAMHVQLQVFAIDGSGSGSDSESGFSEMARQPELDDSGDPRL